MTSICVHLYAHIWMGRAVQHWISLLQSFLKYNHIFMITHPEKLTRTEGFLQVSKASEESSTRRSSKGHLVWVHVLFWQCLNLRELDKHDKPHPSDTSGRTNADKNLCSFNIECSDTRKYVLYVHSEPVCSGVLGAWCSSSCLPRQKLYKQRLSHM